MVRIVPDRPTSDRYDSIWKYQKIQLAHFVFKAIGVSDLVVKF